MQNFHGSIISQFPEETWVQRKPNVMSCFRTWAIGHRGKIRRRFALTIATIMDKSLGTVVHFERYLTHAKLDPRATNTVRPYPLPPPHGQY